jgi:hypothetical protein
MESLFKRIDSQGGWPLDKRYATILHSLASEVIFTDNYIRDEWHTTLYSSDDYYWWKISKEGRTKFREEGRRIKVEVTYV